MRRDTIFYRLFQQSPELLFELLENKPENPKAYRFDSVAVKEPKFEIDGVFLPPESELSGIVYFCEVQFQRDEQLYERLFGESFLYFYRNRERFSDWQAVVIYASRSIEQNESTPYEDLLTSPRMHRIYLNELGDIQQLPLGLALMVLTTLTDSQAPVAARNLLERADQSEITAVAKRGIIEMVATIMVYKFTNLSRQEIEEMLGVELQQTRVYQEAREEQTRFLLLRQLAQKIGTLPNGTEAQISALSLEQLEALALALLSFRRVDDLIQWLESQG